MIWPLYKFEVLKCRTDGHGITFTMYVYVTIDGQQKVYEKSLYVTAKRLYDIQEGCKSISEFFSSSMGHQLEILIQYLRTRFVGISELDKLYKRYERLQGKWELFT
jgi:hypothetical protein